MLEKNIQAGIIKYINSLPGGVAENVKGVSGQAGRPDINACYRGRMLRIEVKSPEHGNVPTPLQIKNLKTWGKAGAIAIVAYSVEDVKNLLATPLTCTFCYKNDPHPKCTVKPEYCFTTKMERIY